ncbi:MAG: hypothetical protein ACPGLV_16620, partial [Bacteroidia bacterium]
MIDFWDKRYGADEFAYGTLPNEFLKEQLKNYSEGSILLPAEGEGRNAVFAAKQGFEVTAFDMSTAGQKKALQLAKSQKVEIDYEITQGLLTAKAEVAGGLAPYSYLWNLGDGSSLASQAISY